MNKEKNKSDRIRYNMLTIIVYIVGIILLIQLFNLQIIHGEEYRETSNSRLTRETVVKAARGSIKDRIGVELVRTEAGYSVEIYSTKVSDEELNSAIDRFIKILESNKDEYIDNLPISVDPFEFTEESEEKQKKWKNENKEAIPICLVDFKTLDIYSLQEWSKSCKIRNCLVEMNREGNKTTINLYFLNTEDPCMCEE